MSVCKKILKAIDFRTMNERVVVPCRIAEQSYVVKYMHIKNIKEFQEECALYWKHLHSAYHKIPHLHSLSDSHALSNANQLLEQSFNGKGGIRFAYEKAVKESFGAIKVALTKTFIDRQRNSEVDIILATFVDPYDFDAIKELIKEFVKLTRRDTDEKIDDDYFYHMVTNYKKVFYQFASNEEQLYYNRFN